MADSAADREFFENEVRRIARALWPQAQFSGAAIVEGRERDGVFETEECIHLIEATVSGGRDKAAEDIAKLVKLATTMQKHAGAKAIKCWFVTKGEPTPDQRGVAEKHRNLVNAVSFAQFQSRLIDTLAYLEARGNYGFGSVRDPRTGSNQPRVEYVETFLADVTMGTVTSPRDLANLVRGGRRAVVLGDYGAGKSMTMRYLFMQLRRAHQDGKTSQFPVLLNLRDHQGQTDAAEILRRHAVSIGFDPPHHLVRAWRAGYVHLLLDGFDELTPLSIQGLWKKLRENRYRAMETVRQLVRAHPEGAGLALTGRAHFFDSEQERRSALGLAGSWCELTLSEFTDEQISEYFRRASFVGSIPPWLPTRPLLVAYLASYGLLGEILKTVAANPGAIEPAAGWDFLIDQICRREAEIEAGIDGETVRRILERLATMARAFQDGLGPLREDDLLTAFEEVCGSPPDEGGMLLLQRLPGLGIDQADQKARFFVDTDFVDACRAGDLFSFIESPYASDALTGQLESGIGSLGLEVAAERCRRRSHGSGAVAAALQRAVRQSADHLTSDLVRLGFALGCDFAERIYVREVLVPDLDLETLSSDASQIEFQDCLFSRLSLDGTTGADRLPKFVRCHIAQLDGPVSERDLPPGVFQDCEIEACGAASETTDAVLALAIPRGARVLLTILKKLYERRGSGRRENALSRGLDHAHKRLVPDVLRLIQAAGLASSHRRGSDIVWLPDRSERNRVGRIIASPTTAADPLLEEARRLS